MFFLICFMWPFVVVMEGGRCFMGFTVRLGQVVKWLFLMDWSKFLFTGIKRAVWCHLASYGLLLAVMSLSAAGC